jgi:hypothetical protein
VGGVEGVTQEKVEGEEAERRRLRRREGGYEWNSSEGQECITVRVFAVCSGLNRACCLFQAYLVLSVLYICQVEASGCPMLLWCVS